MSNQLGCLFLLGSQSQLSNRYLLSTVWQPLVGMVWGQSRRQLIQNTGFTLMPLTECIFMGH